MNKKFLLSGLVCLGLLGGLVSCKDKSSDTETVTTDKESALKQAVTPYVTNTAIATYSNMADAGMPFHGRLPPHQKPTWKPLVAPSQR